MKKSLRFSFLYLLQDFHWLPSFYKPFHLNEVAFCSNFQPYVPFPSVTNHCWPSIALIACRQNPLNGYSPVLELRPTMTLEPRGSWSRYEWESTRVIESFLFTFHLWHLLGVLCECNFLPYDYQLHLWSGQWMEVTGSSSFVSTFTPSLEPCKPCFPSPGPLSKEMFYLKHLSLLFLQQFRSSQS